VCHLCLAIKPRVCFQNLSLSRLRCSGVASAYGWVTILLYCLWLNEHIHYILTKIQDDGQQVHDHTHDDKFDVLERQIFRFGGSHDVQTIDWILDVPG
jgi:hypothetical protein